MTDYLFSNATLARIQAAEHLFDEGTERVIGALPFDRDGTVLEAGCGGGSIARWLCGEVSRSGRVVATDLDIDPLVHQNNPLNLEVRRHDLTKDPLEERAYDLVHARLLLEHLPDRTSVLGKLVRALKPGGFLVLEDMDYASAAPVTDYGRALHERVQSVRLEAFAANGSSSYLGRNLPQMFREAGLVDVAREGRVQLIEGGSENATFLKLSLDFLHPRLTLPGMLSSEEIDQMLALLEDENFSTVGPIMFAVWGRKP